MSKHEEDESIDASATEVEESDVESSDEEVEDESEEETKPKKKNKKKKEKKVKKDKKEKKPDKKKEKSEKKDKKKSKDKEKSSKSSKRGPRGPQWMNWKIPYQEGSALAQSFELAAKKGGIDINKLTKEIKKMKATPAFIIRKLKKGHSKGFKWDVDDSNSRLRITGCKLVDKKWKRAA